jgi:hypothetical protein
MIIKQRTKQLKMKDLKDKKILQLLKEFEEISNDLYYESIEKGYNITKINNLKLEKDKIMNKLILHLNKNYTGV